MTGWRRAVRPAFILAYLVLCTRQCRWVTRSLGRWGGHRAHDDLVLRPGLGQPWLDGAARQGREERVTRNEHAPPGRIRQDPCRRGLTRPRRPLTTRRTVTAPILARPAARAITAIRLYRSGFRLAA